MRLLCILLPLVGLISADPTVYFKEEFNDGDAWKDRWVESTKGDNLGKFVLSAGKFYGDAEKSKGLQTSEDARFYGISAKFEPFSNEDKTLVIQFTVKHEQNIDCGGGYVKLFDCSLDQTQMHGESPYLIMFGPDICGPGTKKVHAIFNYKGKNHLINKEKIKDPDAKKPEDWDDRAKIDDPDDKKPEDWDKPEYIPDPDATKPEDWDDDMDGEWEPPQINNPEYKGEWKPKQIDNPAYKGAWVHPEIDNPEYTPDPKLYRYKEICKIGFDLWQVKSGTIFDNILITDDEELFPG
ncbi:hypothetical protein MRX96_054776 [Rhipicephalus microplus]